MEVTFTIVTCAANSLIGKIHDRMPVILDERAAEDWMNPQKKDPMSLKLLLVPAPSGLLIMQPASPLINSVKNEGAALLVMPNEMGTLRLYCDIQIEISCKIFREV